MEPRSKAFNRYYHKVVVVAVQKGFYDVGYNLTTKETHEELKYRFLKVSIINEETWEYLTKAGSTTTLTNKEFREYVDRIQQFSAEWLGVYVPDPNEETITT